MSVASAGMHSAVRSNAVAAGERVGRRWFPTPSAPPRPPGAITPVHGASLDRLELRVAARPAEVSRIRRALRQFLRGHPISPASAADLLLIASELATNAVQASHSPSTNATRSPRPVAAPVVLDPTTPSPFVSSCSGFPPSCPPAQAARGRGLPIVHALSERVDVECTGEGTVVRAHYSTAGSH